MIWPFKLTQKNRCKKSVLCKISPLENKAVKLASSRSSPGFNRRVVEVTLPKHGGNRSRANLQGSIALPECTVSRPWRCGCSARRSPRSPDKRPCECARVGRARQSIGVPVWTPSLVHVQKSLFSTYIFQALF